MEKLKVLKKRNELTTIGLHPTSFELYDLMSITTCEQAVVKWEEEWSFCPVCLARYESDGSIIHQRSIKNSIPKETSN